MKKPYVIEVINFLHELDLLEAHLDEHTQFIDRIVVIESKSTYSGLEKPLYFKENEARFRRFNIEYEEFPTDKFVKIPDGYDDANRKQWFDARRNNREAQQKYIFAKYSKEGDYVCNSDVDEIWSVDAWDAAYDMMKDENCYIAPRVRRFMYYIDAIGRSQDYWRITKSTQSTHVRQRGTKRGATPVDIGWHFSSMYKDAWSIWMKGVGLAQSIGCLGWTKVPTPDEIEVMMEKGEIPFINQHISKVKRVMPVDDLSWLPPYMRDNPDLWRWLPEKYREGKPIAPWKAGK